MLTGQDRTGCCLLSCAEAPRCYLSSPVAESPDRVESTGPPGWNVMTSRKPAEGL